MKTLKVGIDNYSLQPLEMEPLEVLNWAGENGAEGVQFSGLEPRITRKVNRAYLEDLREYAASEGLYLEWGGGQHIPRDMTNWGKKDLSEVNRRAAEEAAALGTRIIRSCSGGLMRWNPESPKTEILLTETADCLRSQKQMLRDHNVILAIETHFEFTTFELLRLFEMCEIEPGDCLGICLDTMNLLTMLEDPVLATERVLPWVVSTHIKDGALFLSRKGILTFPTAIDEGIVYLQAIIKLLAGLSPQVNLSIEDHGGSFRLPIFEPVFLSGFPDLSLEEFSQLVFLAATAKAQQGGGRCSPTPRKRWPRICEERIKTDIQRLKEILESVQTD